MPDEHGSQSAPLKTAPVKQGAAHRGATAEPAAQAVEIYSPVARALHWLTVVIVAVMVPVGLVMTARAEKNIWDGLTNNLYSGHKLAGITLLVIVVVRLIYRLVHGAPRDEPTLEPFHKLASHATHWAIYALLLAIPMLGWLGVSLYPALDVFGVLKLPALVAPNQPTSSTVFMWHKLAAFALVGLVAMHMGAALYHHFIRGDSVLRRMLPGLKARGRDGA